MRRIELYQHNRIAYEKAVRMLKEEGKAAIIHPTGTGKSFIAFALVLDNPDKKFLWLSPSMYIYDLQCKNLWQKQHIRFTNIEFHTYAWLMRNDKDIEKLDADYIILDEFHRTGAHEWEKSIRKLIEAHPQAKLLGLSATKVRYLDNQRDMAEEIFEGCIASEIGICEAMAQKILPEPKYIIAAYSYEQKLYRYETKAAALTNKRQKAEVEKLIERLRCMLQEADGIDKIFKKHLPKRDSKLIIFCRNEEHMMELMAQVPEWFFGLDARPHVYYVSTHNPESEESFKTFVQDDSDHLKLLFCIDMLNEGIHVDDVDAVVLCRPTVSPVIYKQQIGRAIAVGNGKKPIIFDMVNNFDNLYQINTFKQELIGAMSEQRSVNTGIDENEIIKGFEVIDELCGCREMLEQLQRNLDASWNLYYQELCSYKKEYGSTRVPKVFKTADGLRLGIWLARQRSLYREGILGIEYINALERVGVSWDTNNYEIFEKRLEKLRKYKEEKGDLLVPDTYKTPDGTSLGTWVQSLRIRYRKGKLSQKRVEQLTEMGFVWEPYEALWEKGFQHAKAYYEKYGNLEFRKKYVCEDGFKLGDWVYVQRNIRLGRTQGRLTDVRIRMLDSLKMVWTDKKADSLERHLEAYKKYIAEGGERVIPSTYVTEDGVKLGAWSGGVRSQYFQGHISKDKLQKLKDVGFFFHRFSYTWYTHYKEAKQYYEEYGNLFVKHSYLKEHGGSLNQWLNNQRNEYRKTAHGMLFEDQIKLLEEIHIYDDVRIDERFAKGLKAYREYIKQKDSVFVPCEYKTPEGYPLGKWLKHHKEYYKKGILSEIKFHLLSESGMVWENTIELKAREFWDDMYKEAMKYAEENGSIKNIPPKYVTEDGKKLGAWVGQQRRIRKGSIKHSIKMTNKRIIMLDLIGINWGKEE